MKKTLLSLVAIAGLSIGASAQIEIYVEGDPTNTDYSGGGTYTFYATGESDHINEIHIENHTGTDQSLVVNRRRINEQGSWVDFLCWGHESDNFGGTCIDAASMDSELYLMPLTGSTIVDLADGEYGFVSSHITPSFTDPATVTYRYYVGDSIDPFMDSVDFEVVMTPLSIEETTPELTIGVKPNPASEYMVVTANGVDKATVRIIDVLGNVIMKSSVSGSKNIDVSEYRNGIYFVTVEANGSKVSRKVFVRH